MQYDITIIYPSLFGEISSPWKEEYEIAKKIGLNVATFDEEEYTIKQNLLDKVVVYRGWMLSVENYKKLIKAVEKKKGAMLINEHQFKQINSFSSWYEKLEEYTIKSYFVQDFSELDALFEGEKSYFVKDQLKSLGSEKSIAHSKDEAIEIYNEIQKNRDFEIEDNGICLREVVSIEDEERFFVMDGHIISSSKNQDRLMFVQNITNIILEDLQIVFASIDVAYCNGKNILVELGGLQVSDMNKEGDLEEIEMYYKQFKSSIEGIIGQKAS